MSSINIRPENMARKSITKPVDAILKRRFSVVSSGAKSALNDEILRALKRLFCIKANNEMIAPAHKRP